KVDTLVVDKTGTLTEGKPRLVGVTGTGALDENELLRLAASLEQASAHPLADAVVKGAEERGLKLGTPVDFASQTGMGVVGAVEAGGRKGGVDDIAAEVLPDQKAAVVRELQDKGRIIAMAGDGINDAPALAQAHVGIAMGTGTDVAMQTAAVTLVKGDLQGIV